MPGKLKIKFAVGLNCTNWTVWIKLVVKLSWVECDNWEALERKPKFEYWSAGAIKRKQTDFLKQSNIGKIKTKFRTWSLRKKLENMWNVKLNGVAL